MHPRIVNAAKFARLAWKEWRRDNAMMLAAAVAFYATFSIAPLLLLLLNAGAWIFGEQATRERFLGLVRDTVGPNAARAVQRLISAASDTDAGATTLSVILLVFAASAVFRHLKVALNLVLDVPTKKDRGFVRFLKNRAFAAVVVVVGIVLLLSALGVTAALAWVRTNAPDVLTGATAVWRGAELLVSFVVLTIMFGAILRFVPDITLRWRQVGIGATVAAVLFVAGQFLITAYVARARPTAAYGAAGSVVLLLLYIYFTVLLLFAAAVLTEVGVRTDAEFLENRRRLHDQSRAEEEAEEEE